MIVRPRGMTTLVVATCALLWSVATGARAQSVSDPLYVCVQDDAKIAVFDMSTRSLARVIDLTTLGFSQTAKPHHVVGEPDGSFWYVSLIGENRVIKLDRNDQVVASAEMEVPGLMALSPSLDRLVVSRSMSAVNPPTRVGVIRRNAFEIEEVDVFFPRPHPMVVSGDYAYTGSLGVNQLAAIDLQSETVQLTDIAGDYHSLVQFAVSPDGRTLVASTDLSGELLVFDLTEPSKPRFATAIELGPQEFHPVFTSDGSAVWVPIKSSNEIAIIETSSWSVSDHIRDAALRQPHAIVFSADGRSAFVSFNNKPMAMPGMAATEHAEDVMGGVAVIDVASKQVVDTIELGHNPTGMGKRAR